MKVGRRVTGEGRATSSSRESGRFHVPRDVPIAGYTGDPFGTPGLRRLTLRRSPDGRYQLLHGRRTCSTSWRGVHPTCQSDFTGRRGEGICSVEEDRRGPGEATLVCFFRSLDETVLD